MDAEQLALKISTVDRIISEVRAYKAKHPEADVPPWAMPEREYICKCGLRVMPHQCGDEEGGF